MLDIVPDRYRVFSSFSAEEEFIDLCFDFGIELDEVVCIKYIPVINFIASASIQSIIEMLMLNLEQKT